MAMAPSRLARAVHVDVCVSKQRAFAQQNGVKVPALSDQLLLLLSMVRLYHDLPPDLQALRPSTVMTDSVTGYSPS